jgi:hypothetical protein
MPLARGGVYRIAQLSSRERQAFVLKRDHLLWDIRKAFDVI